MNGWALFLLPPSPQSKEQQQKPQQSKPTTCRVGHWSASRWPGDQDAAQARGGVRQRAWPPSPFYSLAAGPQPAEVSARAEFAAGSAEPRAGRGGHLRGRRQAARRGRGGPVCGQEGPRAAGEAPCLGSGGTASWLFWWGCWEGRLRKKFFKWRLTKQISVYNTLSPFSTAFSSFTVKTWRKNNNRLFPEK